MTMPADLARQPPIVLASASVSRRTLLANAGIEFEVRPAAVDEAALKSELASDGIVEPADVALGLAQAKARAVSEAVPAALVIGADQVLAIGLVIYSKAHSVARAREILKELQGRRHTLQSGVAIARGGEIVWSEVRGAQLTMRKLTDSFIDDYLAAAGERVLSSVGCYQLEGIGIQLFDEIAGDYFTILGLPLLPLLAELRELGAVAT